MKEGLPLRLKGRKEELHVWRLGSQRSPVARTEHFLRKLSAESQEYRIKGIHSFRRVMKLLNQSHWERKVCVLGQREREREKDGVFSEFRTKQVLSRVSYTRVHQVPCSPLSKAVCNQEPSALLCLPEATIVVACPPPVSPMSSEQFLAPSSAYSTSLFRAHLAQD